MKRILVFQHVPHEILGIFNPLLKNAGFRIRYVNFGRDPDAQPDIEKYDGLIILGGPMCVDQTNEYPHLLTELAAIETAMRKDMPVFGICLGAQLIATALGAKVMANPMKEIGWYSVMPTADGVIDPLFRHFDGAENIFQWHGDTFAIPDSAVHLASSPDCNNQAFRYGDKTYGLQFHLEVDAPMIKRWLNAPAMAEEIELADESIDAEQIRAATPDLIVNSTTLGERVFGAYIDLFSSRSRRVAMPSR
jgi:GMP synthase (glutamine-hydrolysing)